MKQEETGETLQLPDQGGRGPGEASTSLVVPVQNGQGDSLNLSAGFIQVLVLVMDNSIMHQPLNLHCHAELPRALKAAFQVIVCAAARVKKSVQHVCASF